MAEQNLKCLSCEQEFNPIKGEFTCPTGDAHQLEAKTYYMDDAPSDPGPYINGVATGGNRRDSQCMISNLVPEREYLQGTERRIMPGKNVVFVRGVYTTSDAQEQFYLDRRQAQRKSGLCSKERWQEVYLTDSQKVEIGRMQLEADRNRLEAERNELLAMKRGERGPDLQAEAQNQEQQLRNEAKEAETKARGGRRPAMVGA